MKNTAGKAPKVFLDTNILIDYLLFRGGDSIAAEQIIDAAMDLRTELHVAAHSLTNAYYILRKEYSTAERKFIIRNICALLKVDPVSGESIEKAITDGLAEDLEDALQIRCAIDSDCDYFVTRDAELFERCPVKTLLPQELLRELSV